MLIDEKGMVSMGRKRKAMTAVLAGVACTVVVGLTLCHPWSVDGADAQTDGAERDSGSVDGESGNVTIAGQEVDYYPGEYGAVVVDGPSAADFSSEQAWQDYRANWHDKAWKGELPASGRYQYAHFQGEEDFSWVAGEVLAVFGYDTSDERIAQVASDVGARLGALSYTEQVHDYKTAIFYYPDNELDPIAVGQEVQNAAPEVVAAMPNVVSETEATTNDAVATNQGYLLLSRFKDAWDVVKCQGTVEVAVFDSGIDFDHPDLRDNIDTANAYDAIEKQHLDREDVDGHGTKVAGVIAASANNGIGIAGCSYNARILPIRVQGDNGMGNVQDLGEGLGRLFDLGNKPEVVNMSFGHVASSWFAVFEEAAYSYICQGRINELSNNYGIVFVASSGNNGDPLHDGDPGNDGVTPNATEYPAALDHVIGVGSVDWDKSHSYFSTANDTVDLVARGRDVLTTTSDGGYAYASGTSFSAPQVAAAAAMLKAQNPSRSPSSVQTSLLTNAEQLDEQGHSQFGNGLLNAAAAVGWKPSGGGPGGGTSPNTGGSARELLLSAMEHAA